MPFILRMGERNLFVGVGISLVLCASYFALDLICQELGGRATLPPSVAAWLPVVVGVSLAISLHDALRN
jgi:lipopolysaccharide export LptBFGC system permease protein LptF